MRSGKVSTRPGCRALFFLSPGMVVALVVPGLLRADDEIPDRKFVLTDLPGDALVYETERVWLKPLIALVGDYTWFEQDDASILQVGSQRDTAELRAARMGFAVRSKTDYEWDFLFAVDYQEQRTRTDAAFQLYDFRLRLPLGAVKLDVGKMKQPFSFEIGGLSIQKPQQERILSPFFVTRSIGAMASGQLAGDRMTWAAGWFNDWLETGASYSDNADDYVARMTGLVSASPDNRDYLHVGVSVRRAGPDSGLLQLAGRPESHVTDYYVDTGAFAGDFVAEVGFDVAWDRGPFLFVAEHIEARAKSSANGNPRFSGNYFLASWLVTGESRPYLRPLGITGAVEPVAGLGALELVVRYSRLDLTDGLVRGGVLKKWHFGANWWISPQWKAGVSWGDADLQRNDLDGNTRMLLVRLQWLY